MPSCELHPDWREPESLLEPSGLIKDYLAKREDLDRRNDRLRASEIFDTVFQLIETYPGEVEKERSFSDENGRVTEFRVTKRTKWCEVVGISIGDNSPDLLVRLCSIISEPVAPGTDIPAGEIKQEAVEVEGILKDEDGVKTAPMALVKIFQTPNYHGFPMVDKQSGEIKSNSPEFVLLVDVLDRVSTCLDDDPVLDES